MMTRKVKNFVFYKNMNYKIYHFDCEIRRAISTAVKQPLYVYMYTDTFYVIFILSPYTAIQMFGVGRKRSIFLTKAANSKSIL